MPRLVLVLFALFLLAVAIRASAKTVTENRMDCDQEMTAALGGDGSPHAYVMCITYDVNGEVIRTKRQYDVIGQFTPAQRAGLINILGQLQNYAQGDANIPSPTPKPTSTP